MTQHVFRVGVDVAAREDVPKQVKPGAEVLGVRAGEPQRRQVFLRFSEAAEALRGETVLSAVFTGRPSEAQSSHTVTVTALSEQLRQGQATWDNKPAVSAAGQSSALIPATAKDARWASGVDVTAIAQQIADVGHYGLRVTTDSTSLRLFNGFDSGQNAWRMVVVTSDLPDAPSSLEPSGGSVGLNKPTLTWQVDDPDPDDGQPSPQVAFQVQIDRPVAGADPDENAPDVDTGTVTSPAPEYAMSGGSYSLVEGAATFWRVRTRGTSQDWSEWSDWAEIVYYPYKAVSITSPSGSFLYDPSPSVEFTVAGSVPPAEFRWIVGDPLTGEERYDSDWEGVPDGSSTTVGWSIPFRAMTAPGVVFPTPGPWPLTVRVVDRDDRVRSPGDLGYVEVTKLVTLSDTGQPAPQLLSVDQTDDRLPYADLRFTATAAPDAWEVIRDGVSVADVPHSEVKRTGPGVWTLRDESAKPGFHTYVLRALTLNGGERVRSKPSNPATVTLAVKGVWLIRTNKDGSQSSVMLTGDTENMTHGWSTSTFQPLNGPRVDITYFFQGLVGDFTGYLNLKNCRDVDDFEAQLATLRAIQRNPEQRVRLVYAEASVPVHVAKMAIPAAPGDNGDRYTGATRGRRVSFEFWQVDDFDADM